MRAALVVLATARSSPVQHERVQPEHHDHRGDCDEHRGGARVEVHAGPGLQALLAEDEDAAYRRRGERHLGH